MSGVYGRRGLSIIRGNVEGSTPRCLATGRRTKVPAECGLTGRTLSITVRGDGDVGRLRCGLGGLNCDYGFGMGRGC